MVIFFHWIAMAWCFPPIELTCFFMGILAWRFHQKNAEAQRRPIFRLGLLAWLFMIIFSRQLGIYVLFQLPLLALGALLFLGSLFQISQRLPWDRAIADYSYPVYLTHFFFKELGTVLPIYPIWLSPTLTVLLLSLASSWLLLKFVMRPADHWRRQFLVGKPDNAPV
jgi:peptidoglycan/LPS O-acetylase OafA/YrhL